MMFDTKQFLDDYNIPYSTSGKNTTKGWIQMPCFFPDCSDHSQHMGVHINSGTYHCWICDRKGPAEIMAMKLLNINLRKAEEVCKKYRDEFALPDAREKIKNVLRVEVKGFSSLKQMHRDYLISRNFDPDYLQRVYKIGGFGVVGRFPYRIGIPVYINGKLVNMTARDVTGQQERYLSLKNSESHIDIKDCVYNFDNLQEFGNILIVEGCFDAWRIGGSTCSMFGTSKSYSQILKVLSKQPRNIFVLFDKGKEAQKLAKKIAYSFAPFVPHVENLEIDDIKDPAELSNDDALMLRNELGL